MRRSIIVVEDFYADPLAVRAFALTLAYYTPYETAVEIRSGQRAATWWASQHDQSSIFAKSGEVRAALETATGETIDLDFWRLPFPAMPDGRPIGAEPGTVGCAWNCSFHVKPANDQRVGEGVHNHVTDGWNAVGPDGWAGIIYLSPDAPIDGGLHLWRNSVSGRDHDWMTPAECWQRIDSFGNVFNRLVLVRGNIPHSGSGGWGNRIEDGRLYQTFFFRTRGGGETSPVQISA